MANTQDYILLAISLLGLVVIAGGLYFLMGPAASSDKYEDEVGIRLSRHFLVLPIDSYQAHVPYCEIMLADLNVIGRWFHAGKCRKIRRKSMNGSAEPRTLQLQGQEGVGDEV